MEIIHTLEATLARWYDKLPHLPKRAREWLANNIWWLVLIGVIVSCLVVIGLLTALMFGTIALTATAGVFGAVVGAAATAIVIMNLAYLIALAVLYAVAVQPLKARRKRGWELLFIALLVNVALAVLTLLFGERIGSFIQSLLGAAIAGYFLFEIRQYFVTTSK